MTGRAGELVIEEIRDIETRRSAIACEPRDDDVVRRCRRPRRSPRCAPRTTGQSRAWSPSASRRIQELDEPRQPPRGELERQRPAQRLVEIRLLAHRERAAAGSHQHPQPGFQELDIERGRRELQRIKARRLAVLERAVLAAQGAHQDLKPPVLVEDDLGRALARRASRPETR